jgi:hypothetical protein
MSAPFLSAGQCGGRREPPNPLTPTPAARFTDRIHRIRRAAFSKIDVILSRGLR